MGRRKHQQNQRRNQKAALIGPANGLLRPMLASDLKIAIAILGLETAQQAADVFGVSRRAVFYWMKDGSGRPVPPQVAALVRLAVADRIALSELGTEG